MKTHKDVHLRQLDYFLVAAETESFTEAAAKLSARGVSVDRSMVGRQIGDLEDFLGVDLFDDTGRSIKLNDAGRAFAKDAEQLLTMFSEAVHALRTQAPNSIADLQLGFARTPTLEFRKKTTLLFDDIAAPCRVLLHDLAADACKRNLLMGELHVAFVPEPLSLPPNVEFEPLVSYQVCCVVGRKHEPLAGQRLILIGCSIVKLHHLNANVRHSC